MRRLTGELTLENYDRFSEVIFEEINDVVGLDLLIKETPSPSGTERQHFVICLNGAAGLLTYRTDDQGGVEILINGGLSPQWGMWRADGFYLVKSGGTHQGISSVGLIPTDEALIRLNPAVKILNIRLEAGGGAEL